MSHPVTLFQQLLTNPKAETLMKSHDIELLRYLCHQHDDVDKYWNTIHITKHNGYNVKDPQMRFDYIKMLECMGKRPQFSLADSGRIPSETRRVAHQTKQVTSIGAALQYS